MQRNRHLDTTKRSGVLKVKNHLNYQNKNLNFFFSVSISHQRPRDLPESFLRMEFAAHQKHEESSGNLQRSPQSFRLAWSRFESYELPLKSHATCDCNGRWKKLRDDGNERNTACEIDTRKNAVAVFETAAHGKQYVADSKRTFGHQILLELCWSPRDAEEYETLSNTRSFAPATSPDKENIVGWCHHRMDEVFRSFVAVWRHGMSTAVRNLLFLWIFTEFYYFSAMFHFFVGCSVLETRKSRRLLCLSSTISPFALLSALFSSTRKISSKPLTAFSQSLPTTTRNSSSSKRCWPSQQNRNS